MVIAMIFGEETQDNLFISHSTFLGAQGTVTSPTNKRTLNYQIFLEDNA